MSEYMFGTGKNRPTRKNAQRIERIAQRHYASFVEMYEPGCGCGYGCSGKCPARYMHWFAGPNYGAPQDQQMQSAVYADLRAAGLLDEQGRIVKAARRGTEGRRFGTFIRQRGQQDA